jgi:hypothetical protein
VNARPVTHSIAIVIEGYDAPDRTCTGPDGIGLGIQRGSEVVDVRGSSTEVPTFHAELSVVEGADGPDFRGPYVHGSADDRFLYLAWVSLPQSSMVARIKLRLNDIAPEVIEQAVQTGASLHARVRLTNATGKPASGSMRPPQVTWSHG